MSQSFVLENSVKISSSFLLDPSMFSEIVVIVGSDKSLCWLSEQGLIELAGVFMSDFFFGILEHLPDYHRFHEHHVEVPTVPLHFYVINFLPKYMNLLINFYNSLF